MVDLFWRGVVWLCIIIIAILNFSVIVAIIWLVLKFWIYVGIAFGILAFGFCLWAIYDWLKFKHEERK